MYKELLGDKSIYQVKNNHSCNIMPITQVRKSEKIKQKEYSLLLNQEREAKSLLTESSKTTTEQVLAKCRQWCEGS